MENTVSTVICQHARFYMPLDFTHFQLNTFFACAGCHSWKTLKGDALDPSYVKISSFQN
jgi:hypothetical protein